MLQKDSSVLRNDCDEQKEEAAGRQVSEPHHDRCNAVVLELHQYYTPFPAYPITFNVSVLQFHLQIPCILALRTLDAMCKVHQAARTHER